MPTASRNNPAMRRCIQKVATGPEYSKNLNFDEAHEGGRNMLLTGTSPIQIAVFLIGLRMKRETEEENTGILQAILESVDRVTAPVDELLDIGEPYNGYTRCLPMSAFLPAVLAACRVPTVIHGVEASGPKYGATAHRVLRAAGKATDLCRHTAAAQLGTAGWTYIDQSRFCPPLYALLELRNLMVKRSVLNTLEVLAGPIRGRDKTHLMTGYVHKAYPPTYANLARQSGFSSAIIVRGSEGGVMASLRSPTEVFAYHDSAGEKPCEINPASAGIRQTVKAVPLPASLPTSRAIDSVAASVDVGALATAAAQTGLAALEGSEGAARDSLIYTGAVALTHLKQTSSMEQAANRIRNAIDSGEALEKFEAAA